MPCKTQQNLVKAKFPQRVPWSVAFIPLQASQKAASRASILLEWAAHLTR